MTSSFKPQSLDFHRKFVPREASGTRVYSVVLALCMLSLFGMELRSYYTIKTYSSVIVDTSADGELLRVQLNISFPSLPCEYASVDISDVLGTNQLNITKTIRKFPIDSNLKTAGSEFPSGHTKKDIKHGSVNNEDLGEGSISLSSENFDRYSSVYPVLVVKFYAPWCLYSKKLAPAWEEAAKIIRERYDSEMDRHILIGDVDCEEQAEFCNRNRIHGYPSIRIFRNGGDVRGMDDHERLLQDHEHLLNVSYYGVRDCKSLVAMMESLVVPNRRGCRIEGFLHVKKVPGDIIISARSASRSFDSFKMNMSHVVSHLSFGNPTNAKLLSDMKSRAPYIGASHGRLNGKAFIIPQDMTENVTIEHYLQVVKTEMVSKRGYKEELLLEEYEYTAQSSISQGLHIPVAKFRLELSPVQVFIEEKHW